MPNWCLNKLALDGEAEALARFEAQVTGRDPESGEALALDFERILPLPEALSQGALEVQQAWREAHWGTRWNLNAEQLGPVEHPENGALVFRFETAWGPPRPVIEALAGQFPALTLKLVFCEPNAGFVGMESFAGGSLVASVVLERPDATEQELGAFLIEHGLGEEAAIFEEEGEG